MVKAVPKLGDILTDEGTVSAGSRDKALRHQAGGKLGQILLNHGNCNGLELYQAIARQRDLRFVNLLETPPHAELLQVEQLGEYFQLKLIPWRRERGGKILLAGVEFGEAQQQWAEDHYANFAFVQTAPLDIHRSLSSIFPKELSHQSIYQLSLNEPLASASTLWRKSRHWPMLLLVIIAAIGLSFAPAEIMIGFLLLMNGFHLLTLSFKALLFYRGKTKREALWNAHLEKPRLPDSALPVYTILIPIYKEARVLPQLVENLRALDYPKQHLDIKLVIEDDDKETFEMAKSLALEGMFEIIHVPYSEPRTKPKACNYALHFARGAIVTIYDAEDKPHPQQLREVVHRFFYGEKDLVCVQCRLNYYNRSVNLLTKLFSIEYAAWFDFMIPGLTAMKMPIPLGGTSNHIYRKKLIELGEWDPFNVTEDADLGIRLSALRYRTEILQSITMEEAPMHLWPWIKQRSRWIKGYMQTWLVHMRRPAKLWRNMGTRGFFAFQLFIGGPCLVFLSTPILLGLSLFWLLYPPLWQSLMSHWILPLSLSTLAYGVGLHLLFAVEVVRDRFWPGMLRAVLCFPFYWLLHSIASFRALSQLITRPFYWEKTEHGMLLKKGEEAQ